MPVPQDTFNIDVIALTKQLYGIWKPEVQCRIHKVSPIISILSQINPIRIDTYLYRVHLNIFLPYTPRPP